MITVDINLSTTFWTISGWVIAVRMAIWKIIEAIRNQIIITVEIEYPYEIDDAIFMKLTSTNKGKRVVNLIDVGLQLTDGSNYLFLQRYNLRNLWIYRSKNRLFCYIFT